VLFFALTLASYCGANPGSSEIIWYDDMEGDVSGWSHEDLTAGFETKFHIDSYLAFDDPLHETDYSWWCGNFDYDADGGYGDGWIQMLNLPPIVVSQTTVENISWGAIKALYRASDEGEQPSKERGGRPAAYPVLTFAYRYDSEPGYDYTYIQAENLGVFVDLNSGYNGSSNGWQDYGAYGFELAEYDDPLMLRFLFVSDGAWSDEDQLYNSVGGAFHVDNIKVYDFYDGTVYFFDDVQDGSLCSPGVPEAAGDYWHLVDRKCPAYSDPHSWWCGDDSDTSLIPPNLNNALYSPAIGYGGVIYGPCTLYVAIHAEVPTIDNDYWTCSFRVDGGPWYILNAWWGDFEQCDGWGTSGLNGEVLSGQYFPAYSIQMKIEFHTTDNGCGPGAAGGAGIFLDDCWLVGYVFSRDAVGGVGTENLMAGQERLRALRRRRHPSLSISESPYGKF
jgi:hypothetical protein